MVAFLIGITVFFFLLSGVFYFSSSKIEERLNQLHNLEKLSIKLYKLIKKIGIYLQEKSILKEVLDKDILETKLRIGGIKKTSDEFVGMWALFIISALILSLFLRSFSIFVVLFTICMAVILPYLYINHRFQAKKALFQRQFMEFIEGVQVGISSGLNILQAFKWAAGPEGVFTAEINRVIKETELSIPLGEALESFAKRINDEKITNFIITIKIIEKSGGEYSALNKLIKSMRQARINRIDEAAKTAEMKLMFPVILSTLPTTILLVIGPLVVSALGMLF